jgi:hypothetical protein
MIRHTPGKRKPKPPLERVVQGQIVDYLKLTGWAVWQTSQGHKHPKGAKGLRITPGIPDLYCLHATHGPLWIECKREGNDLTEAQIIFASLHDLSRRAPPRITVHSLGELLDQLKQVAAVV